MEAWRGHFPLCLFKSGVIGSEVPFYHWCSSSQIFWGPKNLFPNFPKHAQFFVQLLPTKFLPQRSLRRFFGVTSKKDLHVFFCKPWAPFFEQLLLAFLPRFSANQTFCGCACNHCTPTFNTTVFHNSIIGNFVVYQDRPEINLLQLFGHLENSEWFSIIFVIIFEVNIVDEQKET